ncbi:uncharacterized protein LOC114544232 [Dendronephthya gigantea]|uniref:uncharacterized protein LOC114544232 n=1 Tax=Dendronephthya gigantea TaxID=151771 RepID=UPI00106CBC54|nr:uncharacterized protein LOC114544232 [Dendronephthya gigantea]
MQLPNFLNIFNHRQTNLTLRSFVNLFKPIFSEEGSNKRKFENDVYAVFVKYLRKVANGERSGISLNTILRFATCDDEIPLLGYEYLAKPSITFYEVPENKSFFPTANTCCSKLQLPRPTIEVGLPDDDTLFNFYDMAFVNEYFGHK